MTSCPWKIGEEAVCPWKIGEEAVCLIRECLSLMKADEGVEDEEERERVVLLVAVDEEEVEEDVEEGHDPADAYHQKHL